MMQLDEERDLELLSSGLQQTSKKPPLIALVKDYLGLLVGADNPTPSGRNSSFASMLGSKVRVEFDLISRRLRRRVLEAVTRERHGDDAVRIVRLLLDTGKMDEKQVHICSPRNGSHLFKIVSTYRYRKLPCWRLRMFDLYCLLSRQTL